MAEAPPPPVIAPAPMISDQTFWLQVAAYPQQDQARTVAGRFGRTAQVQAATNTAMFRVLVGPWSDANAAERARQAAVADGFADALLISAQ